MPVNISESVKSAPTRKGSRWLVTLAVPGQGSSGFYSAEVLKQYGPLAFPTGTRAYWRHVAPEDRDPRDLIGKYEDTFWSEENQRLMAYLKAKPHWNDVIESLGDDLELSIYTNGEKDEEGNVTALYNTRTTSVDAVAWGGLEGSGLNEQIESLVETARTAVEADEKPGADVAQENGSTMELEAKVDNLTAQVAALTDLIKGGKDAEAQAAADAAAVEAAATEAREGYAAAVEAIEAARENLFDRQIKSLLESAKAGDDIAPKISEALEIAKDLREEAKGAKAPAAPGKVVGSGSNLDEGYVFSGFGGN